MGKTISAKLGLGQKSALAAWLVSPYLLFCAWRLSTVTGLTSEKCSPCLSDISKKIEIKMYLLKKISTEASISQFAYLTQSRKEIENGPIS